MVPGMSYRTHLHLRTRGAWEIEVSSMMHVVTLVVTRAPRSLSAQGDRVRAARAGK